MSDHSGSNTRVMHDNEAAAYNAGARTERNRWRDALRDLHRPFGIYDDCGHGADEHTGKTITHCGDFETCLDPMYSICTTCCRDPDGEQTEECVREHGHGPRQPICETAALVARPLRAAGK